MLRMRATIIAAAGVLFTSERSFGSAPLSALSTAACASRPFDTRPVPCQPVSTRICRTATESSEGLTARIIAATPATIGAAKEVPDCCDPFGFAPSGATGMFTPGAHTLIEDP